MMNAILRMISALRGTPASRKLHCSQCPAASLYRDFWSTSAAEASSPPPTAITTNATSTAAAGAAAPGAALAEVDAADLGLTATTVAKPVVQNVLQPRVVIYDGVCHLCHRGVKWVISVDKYRKIKFCCLQSEAAEPYLRLCGVDRKDVLRRFVFIEGLGQYHRASTAALRVLSYLPFPYSALSFLSVVPAPLTDAVYDYVAKRRYDWFGKEEDCLVLKEPEMLERFIDAEEILEKRHPKFY
ncbi:hypothetical protein Dimus_012832 [Dionaea muscipula]